MGGLKETRERKERELGDVLEVGQVSTWNGNPWKVAEVNSQRTAHSSQAVL